VSTQTPTRTVDKAAALTARPHENLLKERIFRGVLLACLAFGVLFLVVLFAYILVRGLARFDAALFLNQFSQISPDTAGGQAAILGSIFLGLIVIAVTVPLGTAAAVYLEEYASRESRLTRLIDVNIQNLAAVPSVVYGLLGLAVFVRVIFGEPSLIVGGLILSLLVLPVVIVSAREALKSVPPSLREGSLGLGATRWQTTWKMVLPNAVPGIATGVILAVSRAIGEAAPLVVIGAGLVTFNPASLGDRFTALPILIFDTAKRPQEEFQDLSAALIIVSLILLIVLNSTAIFIRNKYSRKW
jgi:phosphate transport system permease protein